MVPKAPLNRNDEIQGSDDEVNGGDSDDSLESLSEIIGRTARPAGYQRPANLATTPKAKRHASGFHKSPLTLQNKPAKHKFDLKSLVKHARRDDAADESARRAEELMADAGKEVDLPDEHNPSKMRETAKELLDSDDEDDRGGKLDRAIHRTQVDDQRSHCYFFDVDGPPRDVPQLPFPTEAAEGRWSYLADPSARSQAFIRGIPTTMASRRRELPDELFEWILSEVTVENNFQLRMQYINVAALCAKGTRRLVGDVQLYSMLEKIGGPKYSLEHAEFKQTAGQNRPYLGKHWSLLRSFLDLLARMAPNLAPATTVCAIQLLLRMSLDPIVRTTVQIRGEHAAALKALVSALPTAEKQWNRCVSHLDAQPPYPGVPRF